MTDKRLCSIGFFSTLLALNTMWDRAAIWFIMYTVLALFWLWAWDDAAYDGGTESRVVGLVWRSIVSPIWVPLISGFHLRMRGKVDDTRTLGKKLLDALLHGRQG